MERKLVTLRKINDLSPIPGADAIEVATIDGWKLVVKKGEFKIGDVCVYFEIDSFLPKSDERFAFLMKSTRTFEGVEGHRLRTIKLRGQISQGLALPVHLFAADLNGMTMSDDLTPILGIKKWEAVLDAQVAGMALGLFPSFIRKTDQERCISGNMLITTELGQIAIEDLVEELSNIKVLTRNERTGILEYKHIIAHSFLPKQGDKWLRITTKSGKILECTKEHLIFNPEHNTWDMASQFCVNDKVYIKD